MATALVLSPLQKPRGLRTPGSSVTFWTVQLEMVVLNLLLKWQNQRIVRTGKDLADHLVPILSWHGQCHLPLGQVAQGCWASSTWNVSSCMILSRMQILFMPTKRKPNTAWGEQLGIPSPTFMTFGHCLLLFSSFQRIHLSVFCTFAIELQGLNLQGPMTRLLMKRDD